MSFPSRILPALGSAAATVTYSAEATTLFAAMSTPPTALRKSQIDALVVALKAAGIWTKLDLLYLLAAADTQAARLNWVSPSTYTATITGSPVFTADKGYAGDGSAAYLDTTFNTSTATAPKALQNDNSMWTWMRTAGGTASVTYAGHTNSAVMRGTTTTLVTRDVNSTSDAVTPTTTSMIGSVFGISRSASAGYSVYSAGTLTDSPVRTSQTIISANLLLLARGSTSTASQFTNAQMTMFASGASLDATAAAALQTAMAAYMTAVGA